MTLLDKILSKSVDISQKNKFGYYTTYTLGSYVDLFMCIPIDSAKYTSKGVEKLCDKLNVETPKCLSWENIKENSPTYMALEKLRDKLDTRGGTVFLQSNLIATAPLVFAGMPAAQYAQELVIDNYLKETSELTQNLTNSLITLGVQMAVGYTIFMANEIRANKEKYTDENGKLSSSKIYGGFKTAVKTFLSFDLTYIGSKLAGQSYFLSQGKDPAIASVLFDSFAIPIFYTVMIPISLKTGMIQTKKLETI